MGSKTVQVCRFEMRIVCCAVVWSGAKGSLLIYLQLKIDEKIYHYSATQVQNELQSEILG